MADTEIKAANNEESEKRSRHFIEQEIDNDLATGRFDHVQTRFPPEPNSVLNAARSSVQLSAQAAGKKFLPGPNSALNAVPSSNPHHDQTESSMSLLSVFLCNWLPEFSFVFILVNRIAIFRPDQISE